jgi:hypothetical protein
LQNTIRKDVLGSPMENLKWQCENDLLWLLNWGLGFKDIDPYGRIPYQVRLAKFYASNKYRKIILIPREHFKSTFAKGYIVQELLKNPNKTIFVRSHTNRKATTFVTVIQDRLKRANMQMLYGDLEGDVWREDALNLSTRTEKTDEYNVYATGTGQTITGYHPDEIILDDILDDENYNTEEGKLAIENDYKKLMFCVKKRVIINGTRWGEDDLYGDLLEKNKYLKPDDPDKYDVLLMSCFGEADGFGQTPEKGNFIFPYTYRNNKPEEIKGVTKGFEWLAGKRKLGAYFCSCQVFNNPIPQKDAVFKKDDFNLWDYSKEFSDMRKQMKFYLTVDPAGTDRRYSDYTAIVVCGVTPAYDIYVVEAEQLKIDMTKSHKIIDEIFKYAERWQVKKIGIEQGLLDRALRKPITDRRRMLIAHGKKISWVLRELKYSQQPGTSGRAKKDRIASMAPYFDAGIFHIHSGLDDLQRQLMRWRSYSTSHDDIVDALAYQLQIIPCHIYREIEKETKSRYQRWMEKRFRGDGGDREADFINEGILAQGALI